jgi:hypothetical protein
VERVQQHPVIAAAPTTQSPARGPSRNDGEPRERSGQNRDESRDHGRQDDQGENQDVNDQGGNQDNTDQGDNQDGKDQAENQDSRRPRTTGSSVVFGIASRTSGGRVPDPATEPGLATR